jgi:general secretion pathway protein E
MLGLIDSARLPDTDLAGMSEAVRAMLDAALAAPSGLILFAGSAKLPRIDSRASAERAIEESLAGRVVLASIEAGDAVGAIGLLCALHGEPALVAAMLRAAFAERRARRLCTQCRYPAQASADLSARLGFDPGAIVWRADGCPDCAETGFAGTVGLFEGIAVDPAMRRLIGGGGDPAILASHAFRDHPNLGAAARALAQRGESAGEDAVRLSRAQSQ